MEKKKNSDADLEKKKPTLFLIGFIFALAVVLLAFEYKSYDASLNGFVINVDDEELELPPLTNTTPPPPPPPPPPPKAPEVLELVEEDEIEEEQELDIDDEADENTEVEVREQEEEEVEEPTFTIVEDMPTFPGGEAKMYEYLYKNLKYPAMAKDAGITGTVYVNFVIDKNGKITNVNVLRGIGGGCDEAAIAAVEKMPDWKPGKQRGKAVKVSYNLPVKFQLK